MEQPPGLFFHSLRVARRHHVGTSIQEGKKGKSTAHTQSWQSQFETLATERNMCMEVVVVAVTQHHLCCIRTCALRAALGALLEVVSRKAVFRFGCDSFPTNRHLRTDAQRRQAPKTRSGCQTMKAPHHRYCDGRGHDVTLDFVERIPI